MSDELDFPVIYANFARITHGPLEFLIDFKRSSPEQPNADETAPLVRIVLHPAIAKSFLRALQENVSRYESTFGVIGEPPAPQASVH
jgi:hypothetical protein